MRRKLFLLLILSLVLLVTAAAPPHAEASCSGDDCGCGIGSAECIAACLPGPDHRVCVHDCIQTAVHCALLCCGG